MTKGVQFNILMVLMASRINFVDIYTFYNELDLSVVELLLEELDISCAVKTLDPVRSGAGGDVTKYPEKRLAVEVGDAESARRVIVEAIQTGVISGDGRFLT